MGTYRQSEACGTRGRHSLPVGESLKYLSKLMVIIWKKGPILRIWHWASRIFIPMP